MEGTVPPRLTVEQCDDIFGGFERRLWPSPILIVGHWSSSKGGLLIPTPSFIVNFMKKKVAPRTC
jgi:hypothetical protein